MLGHRGMATHDFRGSSPTSLRSQVPGILIRLPCRSSVCGDGHDAVRAKIHYAYLISGPRFRPNLLPSCLWASPQSPQQLYVPSSIPCREAFFPAPCLTHDVVSISSPKTEPPSCLLRDTKNAWTAYDLATPMRGTSNRGPSCRSTGPCATRFDAKV